MSESERAELDVLKQRVRKLEIRFNALSRVLFKALTPENTPSLDEALSPEQLNTVTNALVDYLKKFSAAKEEHK